MEQLAEGLSVCVTKEHRFGTDAFLLSDFANVRRRAHAHVLQVADRRADHI